MAESWNWELRWGSPQFILHNRAGRWKHGKGVPRPSILLARLGAAWAVTNRSSGVKATFPNCWTVARPTNVGTLSFWMATIRLMPLCIWRTTWPSTQKLRWLWMTLHGVRACTVHGGRFSRMSGGTFLFHGEVGAFWPRRRACAARNGVWPNLQTLKDEP